MARIDDYRQARDLAAQDLAQRPLADIAQKSGCSLISDAQLGVDFLGRQYALDYPTFAFQDRNSSATEVPLQEQVLILHYLRGCRPELTGRWIAYREIPGAGFYFSAFVKRAIDPLKKTFGNNVAALSAAVRQLGGGPVEGSGAIFRVDPLPFAPMQLIIWEGDDEFPAEGNILFDASAGDYLSPEDVAWLAGMVVYRLMSLAR